MSHFNRRRTSIQQAARCGLQLTDAKLLGDELLVGFLMVQPKIDTIRLSATG
jgi:hypothetical protein